LVVKTLVVVEALFRLLVVESLVLVALLLLVVESLVHLLLVIVETLFGLLVVETIVVESLLWLLVVKTHFSLLDISRWKINPRSSYLWIISFPLYLIKTFFLSNYAALFM